MWRKIEMMNLKNWTESTWQINFLIVVCVPNHQWLLLTLLVAVYTEAIFVLYWFWPFLFLVCISAGVADPDLFGGKNEQSTRADQQQVQQRHGDIEMLPGDSVLKEHLKIKQRVRVETV